MNEASRHRYVVAYSFAFVHAALGEKEEALRWLEKAYQDHEGDYLGYIKLDRFLDPLRGDPRVEALVAKIFTPKGASSP